MLHFRQWAWLGWPLLAGGLWGQAPPDLPRYSETLDVSRVVLDVRVPKVVNGEARAAAERLAETLDEKAYSEDEGFFGRLKNAFR